MEITEVRIKLMDEPGERLKAFCSITFDDAFVIRDLKIIEGATGPFVAMPSRKLTSHCNRCGCKNHLRAAYCNQCGNQLPGDQTVLDEEGRAKLYADIAHPINSYCREMIQTHVIEAFEEEKRRALEPGYVCSYDDFEQEAAYRKEPTKQSTYSGVTVQRAEQPRGPHTAHAKKSGSQDSVTAFGKGVFD